MDTSISCTWAGGVCAARGLSAWVTVHAPTVRDSLERESVDKWNGTVCCVFTLMSFKLEFNICIG